MSKVAVIGSGFIGRAWAISFARGGHEVALWDQDPRAPERALAYIEKLLRVGSAQGFRFDPLARRPHEQRRCPSERQTGGDRLSLAEAQREAANVRRPMKCRSRDRAPARAERPACRHRHALPAAAMPVDIWVRLSKPRRFAARLDHGQAPVLWSCEREDGASRRASPAQGAQQSGGEFPPADKRRERIMKRFKSPRRRRGSSQFTTKSRTSFTFPIRNPCPRIFAVPPVSEPSTLGAKSGASILQSDFGSRKSRPLKSSDR